MSLDGSMPLVLAACCIVLAVLQVTEWPREGLHNVVDGADLSW